MEFNIELTIVSVIAITSLVSPILVTYINNKHAEKIKLLEAENKNYENEKLYKRDLAEHFLKMLGMHLSDTLATQEDWQEYAKATWALYPYMEDNLGFQEIVNYQINGKGLDNLDKTRFNKFLVSDIKETFSL